MMFFYLDAVDIPRLRIDQLLNLSWKVLLPLSIFNILLTGTLFFLFFMSLLLVELGVISFVRYRVGKRALDNTAQFFSPQNNGIIP